MDTFASDGETCVSRVLVSPAHPIKRIYAPSPGYTFISAAFLSAIFKERPRCTGYYASALFDPRAIKRNGHSALYMFFSSFSWNLFGLMHNAGRIRSASRLSGRRSLWRLLESVAHGRQAVIPCGYSPLLQDVWYWYLQQPFMQLGKALPKTSHLLRYSSWAQRSHHSTALYYPHILTSIVFSPKLCIT